jgi:CheY-like chemotaxis protein
MATSGKESQTYSVLLADDSETDRVLIREALKKYPRFKLIGEACDGLETIAFLDRRSGRHTGKSSLPNLLLLDLRMPYKSGYEVLEWLQKQAFKNMLVVVLAGSTLPEDYEKSLALGAHAYYVKFPESEARHEMIRSIETLLDLAREGELAAK